MLRLLTCNHIKEHHTDCKRHSATHDACEIQALRMNYPKTIIFCQTYNDCSAIFMTL